MSSRSSNNFTSIPFNLLRIGLALVAIGFFLPIGCKANGYQISQGILGKAKFGSKLMFLSPIDDIYAYILLGVAVFAIIGIILSIILRINFLVPFACGVISFILAIVVLVNFFNKHKIEIEYGAFVMIAGYILTLLSLIIQGGSVMRSR